MQNKYAHIYVWPRELFDDTFTKVWLNKDSILILYLCTKPFLHNKSISSNINQSISFSQSISQNQRHSKIYAEIPFNQFIYLYIFTHRSQIMVSNTISNRIDRPLQYKKCSFAQISQPSEYLANFLRIIK